jgi:hypothetical protein
MFLDDFLPLGSSRAHVVTVLLLCFVPFFRELQKFRLVQAPVKVIGIYRLLRDGHESNAMAHSQVRSSVTKKCAGTAVRTMYWISPFHFSVHGDCLYGHASKSAVLP